MEKQNKIALILGIIAIALTPIELHLIFIIAGIGIALAAIVIGVLTYIKKHDKYSYIGIVFGICGALMSATWLYTYIVAK